MSVVDHLAESQWSGTSDVQEEGDGFDDRLSCMEKFLRGTRIDDERRLINGSPAKLEEGKPRVF